MIQLKDTTETDLLVPGNRVGDVVLGPLLSAGISSEVYQADSLIAGKLCVVKVFRRELRINSVCRGRYRRVAHRVDHLGHAGIAGMYTLAETSDGRSYAVCELAPGRPLSEIVSSQRPMPRRVAVSILRPLCNILALTHAHGLAHLRLHPGNIMVEFGANDTTRVTLLDFGVCQLHPPLNEPPAGLHLRPEDAVWIAPEQARGEVGDGRTDVYALSVLLYELLCGRAPFLGTSYAETLEQHLSAHPQSPSQLVGMPPELDETILRGLEKEPKHRVPSVEALLSAVDPLSATTGQHEVHAQAHHTRQRRLSSGNFKLDELQLAPAAESAAQPVREEKARTSAGRISHTRPHDRPDITPHRSSAAIVEPSPTSSILARALSTLTSWSRQRLLLVGGLIAAALLLGVLLFLS